MRFRSQNDMIAVGMGALAFLIVVLTGIFVVATMGPKKPMNARARQEAQKKILAETADAKKREETLKAKIASLTWTNTPDQVSSTSLDRVSALAKARRLTLMAFRPQKQVQVEGLTQLPFLILVDGPFPAVMQFMNDIDRTDTKLAVSLVQISSADEASDRVSATIGAAAYLKPEVKGAKVASTK